MPIKNEAQFLTIWSPGHDYYLVVSTFKCCGWKIWYLESFISINTGMTEYLLSFSLLLYLNSLSTVGELLNKEDMILFLLMCLSDIIYDFMIVLSTRLSETDVSTILTTLQCKFSIYCLVIGVVSVSMFL